MAYDANVVWHLIVEFIPFLNDIFVDEYEEIVNKLFLAFVVANMGDVLIPDNTNAQSEPEA